MISQQARNISRFALIFLPLSMLGACSFSPTQPSGSTGSTAKVAVTQSTEAGTTAIGERAASIALQQLGVPYRYGGQTPSGFDCSGLVHYSYHQAGKNVPRTTAKLWTNVMPISRSELQPGDLLFFSIAGKPQHVGVYVGEDRFVHAPSTGKKVSVQSLTTNYYQRAFLRAGRPR